MKSLIAPIRIAGSIFALVAAVCLAPPVRAGQPDMLATFHTQYLKLCDVAITQVTDEHSKMPFFMDSYGVRALCAAYDLTGDAKYLAACRQWSDRMIAYQDRMIPAGAYYMNYNRKPGETTNGWYSADSSSIGMAILATAVRCSGADRQRYLDSAKKFADLVIHNYVRPSGGISDGLWEKSNAEWWCSSALCGSFLFNLYADTGDQQYLKTALGVTGWLNHWDLTKEQPFPLSQQGPAMVMYVMENYSAGWPYIIQQDKKFKKAAQAKVAWCFDWITAQQKIPLEDRKWLPTVWWGMKFGGLPFHEYMFAKYLPADEKLRAKGDTELQRLSMLAFYGNPQATQLTMFMLMSYAERLNPGAIYRNCSN